VARAEQHGSDDHRGPDDGRLRAVRSAARDAPPDEREDRESRYRVGGTITPEAVLRSTMGTKETLLELERQLWNADEEFYRETLSEDAVMVFPDPTGILERSAVLESLGGADRWRRVEFDDERLVEVDDDVLQLVYRAVAERSGDGSEYTALITTTYVTAGGSWQLLTHQQTPVGE
jgi:hypothetical protein